jgi:tetratricopeptide (TPR) repeat protein
MKAQDAQTPDPADDWAIRIRALAETNRMKDAMQLAEDWMKAHPGGLDARGWHARLLAWTNQWRESEAEYRQLLGEVPDDVDLISGLADVLTWQRRYDEALPLLDKACGLDPERTDCRLRRAQVLQNLGRVREARIAYHEVLAKDVGSKQAQDGLNQLRESGRHEFRVGTEADVLNYAQNAAAVSASLRSHLTQRWSSQISLSQFHRFDEDATRVGADATLKLSSNDALTVGGATARDQGVIPRTEAQFEYGHGFRIRGSAFVRGVETLYQQRWLWYRDARLLVFSPGAILYLPKAWNWLFRVSAARTQVSANPVEWKPSGWTRLSFPVNRSITGHLLFAAGTENFGFVDQVLQFSARSWGGGLKFRLPSGQEISSFGQFQSRSQGHRQSSFGVNYAVRF